MGSSCLIKSCTARKKKVDVSFHRVPHTHKELCGLLRRVFGTYNVRELTSGARLCSVHIGQLMPLVNKIPGAKTLIEYYLSHHQGHNSVISKMWHLTNKILDLGRNEKEDYICKQEAIDTWNGQSQEDPIATTSATTSAFWDSPPDIAHNALNHNWKDAFENAFQSARLKIGIDSPPSETPSCEEVTELYFRHKESSSIRYMKWLAETLGSPSGECTGEHSMIPDDCEAGAMDATRDPDACMEDKSKKTGCNEDQDINDNHTKVSSQDNGGEGEGGGGAGATNNTMANGEVQTKDADSSEQQTKESSDPASKESVSSSAEDNTKKEEEEEGGEDDDDDDEGGEIKVGDVVEGPPLDIEGSEDEGKDSSEDDEDKLVISEGGNERGTEESADENSKGEAPTAVPKSASRSPTPKTSEKRPAEDETGAEVPTKRSRTLEDPVSLNSLTSVSQVETSIGQVRKDLEAIEYLLKQKEEEWNNVLSLQKRKEELYMRLVRKRHVLMMKSGSVEMDGKTEEETSEESSSNLLFMPQSNYSSLGSSHLPLMMMSQLIAGSVSSQNMQPIPQVTTKPENNRGGTIGNGSTNISIIDIHTQNNKPGGEMPRVSMSSEAHSKLSRQLTSGLASMKPILPKPPATSSSIPGLPPSLSFSATGHGPQGPTVNVQQLIAAHRKENPHTPPISLKNPTSRRATRGAWRHRYDGEKRSSREHDRPPSVSSSSSEADTRITPSNKNLLTLSDPSVSYKDVLLRFAELTQIEKQPGSPQISIFPVGSGESSAKRLESSRESTPGNRDQTPPLPPTVPPPSAPPTSKSSIEAPSALAKLLLESRNSASGGGATKTGLEGVSNSQYLTLSALLSGGSTTTVKDKQGTHPQPESRSKKSTHQEEGSGNPKCQGCHKQRAQFVCAGCGNQWYCSRDCQVAAWEEHSEHCNN